MTTIKRVGVLAHPMRPRTAPIAEHIAETLRAHHLDVWSHTVWDEEDVRRQISDTDMVIAIGGDGAMLRAGRVCARDSVPVLGVNRGHLGFLTEVQDLDEWDETLAAVLSGNYWIEQRMMIRAAALRNGSGTRAAETSAGASADRHGQRRSTAPRRRTLGRTTPQRALFPFGG